MFLYLTPNWQRMVIFTLGGLLGAVLGVNWSIPILDFLLLNLDLTERLRGLPFWVLESLLFAGSGLASLLIYEIMAHAMAQVRKSSMLSFAIRLLIYVVIISLIGIHMLLSILISYYLLKKNNQLEEDWRSATRSAEFICYGDTEVELSKSETTRLLCASALILGGAFRTRILEYLSEKHLASAPEVGLDMELLARVCKSSEEREIIYHRWFAVVGVATLLIGFYFAVLSAVSPRMPASWSQLAAAIVLICGAGCIQYIKDYETLHQLLPNFTREKYEPSAVAQKFVADISHTVPNDAQNIVVYRGFSPFVGAGSTLGSWSFAVNLSKPKDHFGDKLEPRAFELPELYAAVEHGIVSMGIEGLIVTDYLFVNGIDVRGDERILPCLTERPIQRMGSESISNYISDCDTRVRHYKCIRISNWSNELVLSCFLRCAVKGRNLLYVEANRSLLTPLQSRYRQIDTLNLRDRRDIGSLIVRSCLVGPIAAVYAWLALLGEASKVIGHNLGLEARHDLRECRAIERDPRFNYGAGASIRELVSSSFLARYFQQLDGDMYLKILDQQILDTICEFLDNHNIDISELKERQTTILNRGIFVQSGDVGAQSIAVGAGSQAQVQHNQAPPKENS